MKLTNRGPLRVIGNCKRWFLKNWWDPHTPFYLSTQLRSPVNAALSELTYSYITHKWARVGCVKNYLWWVIFINRIKKLYNNRCFRLVWSCFEIDACGLNLFISMGDIVLLYSCSQAIKRNDLGKTNKRFEAYLVTLVLFWCWF